MQDMTEEQLKRYIKEVYIKLTLQNREKLEAYADALRISQSSQEQDG